jgi:osmoprotectant transport system substrate-binding protein
MEVGMKKLKKGLVILLAAVMVFAVVLTGCGQKDTIVIGSKDFSENIILAEIFSQMIENHTDLKVDRKQNLGGTFVCFEAIKNGDIDIYPEYTGTALTAELNMDVISDADETYRVVSEEFVKQFGIAWLDQLGLNNTYTLATTADAAEQYNLETFSDLAAVAPDLVFGAEHEFFNRDDGFDGLSESYGLNFKDVLKMNVSLKYQAIGDGQMEVTDAFATDGQIKQYNLKVLKDDKGFFPPYYVAPIVRNDTLSEHPEIREVLNMLSGKIDDATMQEMNYKADVEKQDIKKVATDFLKSSGLID